MSTERDINTVILIDKIIEKWENGKINADECLYQIKEEIEKNNDNFWDEFSKKPIVERIEMPVRYKGKLPVGLERE